MPSLSRLIMGEGATVKSHSPSERAARIVSSPSLPFENSRDNS